MTEQALQVFGADLPEFEITATGLTISGTPTAERWRCAGQQLIRLSRASRWALGDWVNHGKAQREWGDQYDDALDLLGLEPIRARQYSMTSAAFSPERRRYNVPWSHYRDVVGFDSNVQDRILTLAEEQRWTSTEIRAHLRTVRHKARIATRVWPEGKFGLIYADPPWQYEAGTARPWDAIEEHYPTMALEEIQALGDRVRELTTPNTVLYLWCPVPKLIEATTVLDAWGFRYRTAMVWVKDRLGMGYWVRQRAELLLIGVRGHPVPPAENDRPDSVVEAPRREHSKKPEEVADLLDRLFPDVPKVELFARQARPGWTAWGNEALGDGADLPPGE